MSEELSPRQQDALEARLAERRDALIGEIEQEMEHSRHSSMEELVGLVRDTGDESLADLISSLDSAIANHHLDELRDVEAALRRIKLGRYGYCGDCGEPIPAERLQSIPTAGRCIACQDHHERTHAGRRGASL